MCTVTVMVIRLCFHLESNIMMTLKLDMKHICKKDMRREERGGVGWGLFGLGWGLWEEEEGGGGRSSAAMQRGRQEAQSFSEDGIQM